MFVHQKNTITSALMMAGVFLLFAAGEARSSQSVNDTSGAFEQAIDTTAADIQTARERLHRTRKQVQTEREALLEDISSLRKETEQLREQVHTHARHEEEITARITPLQEDITETENILTQCNRLVHHFRREFPRHLSAAALDQDTENDLQTVDNMLAENAREETAEAWKQMSGLAIDTARESIGGSITDGMAVAPDGRSSTGQFLMMGPALYFKAENKEEQKNLAGPAFTGEESSRPTIFTELSTPSLEAVKRFFGPDRKQQLIPFDPTLGRAVKLAQTRKSLVQHLKQGRVTMIPLLLLGGACIFFAVYKMISLLTVASKRADSRIATILDTLRANDTETAIEQAERLPRPLASVIREGIHHRDAPKDHLEEIMREQMLMQTPALERFLSPLAVCASAAPLLGLLGTVTGMIHTFRLITVFGSGKADLLSSGISEALVTTEVGLIIAVPALLLHAYFSRRVRRALALTRQAAVMFVNGLKYRSEQPEETE